MKPGKIQSVNGHVAGRLFWDADHPSPWMSFPNITAFRAWRAEIWKARPDTKTESIYIDLIWTADRMLSSVRQQLIR